MGGVGGLSNPGRASLQRQSAVVYVVTAVTTSRQPAGRVGSGVGWILMFSIRVQVTTRTTTQKTEAPSRRGCLRPVECDGP